MSEKRFPASLKKLREAKQSGDIPRSTLLTKSAALLGGVFGLWWQAPMLRLILIQTPWLDWPLLWWQNLKQLTLSLALIFGSSVSAAFMVGSLAGGFLFSVGALKSRAGFSRLVPGSSAFISFGLSLFFAGFVLYRGASFFSVLGWASTAKDEHLLNGFVGALFGYVVLAVAFALLLGALQALLSWYLWQRRYLRSSQEFRQDSKDEEGKAKEYFSFRIAEQKKRPG
jgi:flagellar biosynthesis protein FlhB